MRGEIDHTVNDRSGARFDALFASFEPVQRVRLPNPAWLEFLSGPLTAEDWVLIGRVERGELSVDAAMRERGQ